MSKKIDGAMLAVNGSPAPAPESLFIPTRNAPRWGGLLPDRPVAGRMPEKWDSTPGRFRVHMIVR